ncbi:MAG: 30S ribosomal protein S11 [Nitrospirae bacterium]|nr:30S ribosomal protein S11 [Nitrospirota bacterium]
MAEEKPEAAEKPEKKERAAPEKKGEPRKKGASGAPSAGPKASRDAAGGAEVPAEGAPGEAAGEKEKAPPKRKKRGKKNIPLGVAHISVSFNNTIVTLSDPKGHVVSWASGGTARFSGTKKGTPYAATKAAEMAARKAMEHGMRRVAVLVKGPGPGREAAIQGLQAAGIQVMYIKDITPIPHNGCRAPKRRRV